MLNLQHPICDNNALHKIKKKMVHHMDVLSIFINQFEGFYINHMK